MPLFTQGQGVDADLRRHDGEAPPESRSQRGLVSSNRKHLAQVEGNPFCRIPLPRIPQRDLLELRAIAPVAATDMQMAADRGDGAEAAMPVLRPYRSAPRSEAGDTRNPHYILPQREVPGQDGACVRRQFACQATFGLIAALSAPVSYSAIRCGPDQVLIRSDVPQFGGPGHDIIQSDARRPKAVVVQVQSGTMTSPVGGHAVNGSSGVSTPRRRAAATRA